MVRHPAAYRRSGEQAGAVDGEQDGDPVLDARGGDVGAGCESEGHDGDDDAVEEDVGEDGGADRGDDEPV